MVLSGYHGKKSPVTPPGIDPRTVRLVILFSTDFPNDAYNSLGYRPWQGRFISTRFTSCRHLVVRAINSAKLAPESFSAKFAIFRLHTNICLGSHPPSRERQITEKFKDHHRVSGPQNGTCFQRQKFGGDCHIYGKFVGPWMKRCASGRDPICAFSWRI